MKAVTTHARGLVAARQSEERRGARHRAVKRRVEAGHLEQAGGPRGRRLDERDGGGHVLGIERARTAELAKHLGRDDGRLAQPGPTVHDPVPDGDDPLEPTVGRKAGEAVLEGARVAGGLAGAAKALD